MNAATQAMMNLSIHDHMKPTLATSQAQNHLQALSIYAIFDIAAYLQSLQLMADTDWGWLSHRITFCQEQELNLESVVSATPVQLPGQVLHLIYMTSLTLIRSKNRSSVFFDCVTQWLSYGTPGCCVQWWATNLILNLNLISFVNSTSPTQLGSCVSENKACIY